MKRAVVEAGSDEALPEALSRALALISSHPSTSHVGMPTQNGRSGTTAVDVTFDVNLPNEWRKTGESPSGVRLKEVVRFCFPSEFQLRPPALSLRADFNRDLPHMQPWLTDGCPVPCIYDGDLAELLHREGLASILNQTAVWLERAALGKLIDPDQGWEPVRRDAFEDSIVADADWLQELVNRNGRHRFLQLIYLKPVADSHPCFVHGQILPVTAYINPKTMSKLFGEGPVEGTAQLRCGRSVAMVVWPGKHPSGELIVNDSYLPETVGNLAELKERAALYGCKNELNSGLNLLKRCLSGYGKAGPFPLAIILLARRPFNLIGSQSSIELCPYVADIHIPDLFAKGDAGAVRAAAHYHTVTRSLLAQMTGSPATSVRSRWTLIGAGSLGSKLALHLARAGNGPEVVVDKSSMRSHNAARHALVPETGDMQLRWMDAKARVLCEALRGLDQTASPVVEDAANVLRRKEASRRAWSKNSWAVVNATASPLVREAISSADSIPARVIETSLLAGGVAGTITVEGPGRNPNGADLMAECYMLLGENPTLASVVFESDDATSRQGVGQGCGSLTMTMSDGRLSLFAAGMSEYLLARQRDGLPEDGGEILIGRLSENGFGLIWNIHNIVPVTVVHATNKKSWRIHVHSRAVNKIGEETSNWPTAETGGVLMGRVSEASRTVHIVDVLDAPEDSHRSASEFVLGIKGLRQRMKAYSEALGWSLYCLGTWHSHLSSQGPSATDRSTAKAISLACLRPAVALISTPTGWHALLADTGRT